jgi:choline dehydrogenase-like flavoprotein
MEHPAVNSGLFMANKPRFNRLLDSSHMFPMHINANLSLSADAMKKAGVMQYFCRFHRLGHEIEVKKAMSRLSKGFWEPFDLDVLDDIATVLSDLDEAAAVVKEKLGTDRQHPMGYWLDHRIEQSPNPDSRVVLSDKLDQLGVRKADLDWRLNEVDYRTFRVGLDIIVKQLSAAGAGRFIVEKLTDDYINERVTGRNHHMGTTRMAANEKNGVVDPNCRVFGVQNLYVSGSSVFTTAGYGGPTMLIIALALRLADYMNTRLAS